MIRMVWDTVREIWWPGYKKIRVASLGKDIEKGLGMDTGRLSGDGGYGD